MTTKPSPLLAFLVFVIAGWISRQQLIVIGCGYKGRYATSATKSVGALSLRF